MNASAMNSKHDMAVCQVGKEKYDTADAQSQRAYPVLMNFLIWMQCSPQIALRSR